MSWSFWRAPRSQPTAALLGKHPSRPDFLRESCRGSRADALDSWLVSAAALLPTVAALPVTTFCHQLPNRSRALLGVLGPSQDSAGREFPVAIFRELGLDGWAGRGADVLGHCSSFLTAARELLEGLPQLELATVREALAELPELPAEPPEDSPVRRAAGASARDFLQSAFAAAPSGNAYYALSTLATAFSGGGATQLSLDCPIQRELDARSWLELAEQLNRGARSQPSWLLSDEPGRLLISIGPPAPELLCALSDPEYLYDELWPLTTTRQRAIEQAQTSLLAALPELAHIQDRPISIPELGARLARVSRAINESW
jgi:type VI secretion system protein ImpM